MYSRSEKMNVFSGEKPRDMMSLTFSTNSLISLMIFDSRRKQEVYKQDIYSRKKKKQEVYKQNNIEKYYMTNLPRKTRCRIIVESQIILDKVFFVISHLNDERNIKCLLQIPSQ